MSVNKILLPSPSSVSNTDRHLLNGHSGGLLWFTGLSGSGKSTLAHAVEEKLHSLCVRSYVLDGDNIRTGLNKDLGLSPEDRKENIRRIAEMAKLMADAGLLVFAAFIAPYKQSREYVRKLMAGLIMKYMSNVVLKYAQNVIQKAFTKKPAQAK